MNLPYKTRLFDTGLTVRVVPEKSLPKRTRQYLRQINKESIAMAKADKIEFSKFFPKTASFVVVSGAAEGSDEFSISVEISDGSDKVSFYLSDWFGGANNVASLKAIQEGIQKALDFHEKALSKPAVPDLSEGVEKKRVTRSTTTKAKKKTK